MQTKEHLLEAMFEALEESSNDIVTHAALADLYEERGGPRDDVRAIIHRLACEGKLYFGRDPRPHWAQRKRAIDVFRSPNLNKPGYERLDRMYLDMLLTDPDEAIRSYGQEIDHLEGWTFTSTENMTLALVWLYANVEDISAGTA